ncbi:DUF2829 domain-containing protein [Pectinatus frisingensis]|uniref:DUF2829 domain-containing protein n=1 Tax=Pectinatus frisingensis TaxID=865 RepID=UPI0018C70BF8|nr:DUF2829 domain-containing protein [Pectinatus frisingensis]
MKTYIGTKVIKAEPMRLMAAERVLNRKIKDGDSDGYLVTYADGYSSWSPRLVFEKAYRHTNGMTFGLAIEAAKLGKKISRTGWNGKGLFVVYQKGYPQGIPCNKQSAEAWGLHEGDLFKCNPYLQIKQVDGSHSMWVPSIGDVLAEDWQII